MDKLTDEQFRKCPVTFPMITLRPHDIVAQGTVYAATYTSAPRLGVRLGDANNWMMYTYTPDGTTYRALTASFILDNTAEFCGGAYFRGVNIQPLGAIGNDPGNFVVMPVSRWSTKPNRLARRTPEQFPAPCINKLLGKEVVTPQEAYDYAADSIADTMLREMRATTRRLVFCVDKNSGNLNYVMKRFMKRPQNTSVIGYVGGAIRLRGPMHTSDPVDAHVHVRLGPHDWTEMQHRTTKTRVFVNTNSGNACTAYAITLTQKPYRQRLEPLGAPAIQEEMQRLNSGPPAAGASRLALELAACFPHHMPAGTGFYPTIF